MNLLILTEAPSLLYFDSCRNPQSMLYVQSLLYVAGWKLQLPTVDVPANRDVINGRPDLIVWVDSIIGKHWILVVLSKEFRRNPSDSFGGIPDLFQEHQTSYKP